MNIRFISALFQLATLVPQFIGSLVLVGRQTYSFMAFINFIRKTKTSTGIGFC